MSAAPQRVSGIEYLSRIGQDRALNERVIARRLLSELLPYRSQVITVLALNVVSALCQAGTPWLISQAIDRHVVSGNRSGLAGIMVVLLAVYLLEALITRSQMLRIMAIGYRVLASFRERLFERYLRLPMKYLNQSRIGDLISRAISDVSSLNSIFTQSIAFLPGYLLSLAGTLIAMIILSPPLALASFLVIPLMRLSDAYFAREARRAFRNIHHETGEVTAKLEEDIKGLREAQAFNRIETNIHRFRNSILKYRTANLQAVNVTAASAPTFDILSTLGTAIVVGFGAYLVITDSLTIGVLAAFFIYAQQFYRPIQLLSQVRTQVQSSLAASERIYSVLDERCEPEDPPDAIRLEEVRGDIEFDDVTFAYDPGTPVLRNISFKLKQGQVVALVGQTGAGKTTIANLIPRFYQPQEGSVRVDGLDLRDVQAKSLRAHIAVVPQEPFLFSGTIEENIGYGREGSTREEIMEAARQAGAHDFIEALPKGYETQLSERGKPLSQGQRQMISIARAIVANPRILILDEAMGTLDSRTEMFIQGALDQLLKDRTSIIIAHRLSTVRNADLVLVIENGRLVESGTHDELVEQRGIYFDLFRRQFRDPQPGQGGRAGEVPN
ncbi:MAG TPA: ABC transporter ATP-binding protein [Blastocatellia bacterium]|nr:ABC transporter ATP-binding protein [Blastocatellia bacterium]